jgi:REP element-mobilizing transposase RayT
MGRKKYNPEIHQHRSIRIKDYDYSREGLYFITICTFNHVCLFGHIDNGDMVLTAYGEIANSEWLQTGEIRKSILLQEFVIMPNHIHGII